MDWLLVLSLTVTIVSSVTRQLYEGDLCAFGNGSEGKCVLLKDCKSVYNEFLQGRRPNATCGFIGHDPVVCCPNPKNIENHFQRMKVTTTTTTATTTSEPVTITTAKPIFNISSPFKIPEVDPKQYGAVSLRKCYEFGKKHCSKWAYVFGGKKSFLGEFPHMTAIGYKGKNKTLWLCGGSIVAEKFILSAAHCQNSREYGRPVVVKLGNLKLEQSYNDESAKPQLRNIIKIFPHPLYKAPLEYHDIALFELDRPVIFSYFVKQACLSPYPDNNLGRFNHSVTAAGWGVVDWGDDEGSNDLLKADLQLLDHTSCNASYNTGAPDPKIPRGVIDKWQMCAGAEGKDTCQGDSGGPIMQYNEEFFCLFNIIGITSIGKLCGANVPGIYTRVYNYVPWLEKVIWGHEKNISFEVSNERDFI